MARRATLTGAEGGLMNASFGFDGGSSRREDPSDREMNNSSRASYSGRRSSSFSASGAMLEKIETVVPDSLRSSFTTKRMAEFGTEKMVQCQRILTKLYGRDRELHMLRKELDLLTQAGDTSYRSLIRVSGLSGEGKTALALKLQAPAEHRGCFFVVGKFDLASIGQPYSGIKTALSGLIGTKILRDMKPHKIQALRDEIKRKMDWEIDVLCQVIPELTLLVDPSRNSDANAPKEPAEGTTKNPLARGGMSFKQRSKNSNGSGWLETSNHLSEDLLIDSTTVTENFLGAGGADRLQIAFRKLINIVTGFAPLILVCDDIQWADSASIKLLKGWITDEGSSRLLMVWIYRKNLVGKDHFVTKAVANIQKVQAERSITTHTIEVGELLMDDVNEMISDTLDVEPPMTQELTKMLYNKTHGNVFFIRQYLVSLAQKGLLNYEMASMSWKWDIDAVREGCSATATVAALMKEKLFQSSIARKLLPLAACIGTTFETGVLNKILSGLLSGDEPAITETIKKALGVDLSVLTKNSAVLLKQVEKEGLIEAVGADSFAFIHDKVVEGALALVDGDMLDDLKFGMGYLLLQQLKKAKEQPVEGVLFLLVNLLNAKLELLPPSLQLDVCELNLIAGDKALCAAAYPRSAFYYGGAIKLLPEGHWDTMQDISLHLYLSAAESEMCLGNYDTMNRYANAVLYSDIPVLNKLPIYKVLGDAHTARGDPHACVDVHTDVLSKLGYNFPKSGILLWTGASLVKMIATLKKWKPDALSCLPISHNPIDEAIDHMQVSFIEALMMTNPDALPLAVLMSCQHVLNRGLTRYSAACLATLGLIILIVFEDFQWAKEHMEFTRSLLQRLPNRRIEARVENMSEAVWVTHWTTPVHDAIKTLNSGYSKGLETSDLDSAFWCAQFYLEASLYSGKGLALLQKDAETYCKQEIDYGMVKHAECLESLWQLILNLRGHSKNTAVLTGSAHDETRMLKAVEETKDWHHLSHLEKDRLFAAAFFGDFQRCAEIGMSRRNGMSTVDHLCKILGTQYSCIMSRFVLALSCFEMAQVTKKWKYARVAKRNLKILKRWHAKGNPNTQHYMLFLKAEKAALGGSQEKARALYERTILLSGRSGLVHECALANERMATHLLRIGDTERARVRYQDSVNLYEEWGATKKVELMVSKRASLFPG